MKNLRPMIFWLHLACGLVAGLVIGVMSLTGAALAFEKEAIAFAERDARRVVPPTPEARPLAIDELVRRIRAARPDYRPAALVLTNDPHAAIALSAGGRGGGATALYANPYTGEVREASAPRTRAFMRTMRNWHRWLGVEGGHRHIARAVTGAGNFAFLGLAVSGLWLWRPGSWHLRAIRAVAFFHFELAGKARDFNWHNVVGLWSAPILIVLTATALPMSYAWAGNLIQQLTGMSAPAAASGPGGGRFGAAPGEEVPASPEGARPLSNDALVAAVQRQFPAWEQITFRPGAPSASESGVQAMRITLRFSDSWPRTATTTLSLDPRTGAVLGRAGSAGQDRAQQVRSWTRFLHTGEALGWAGQLVAGLASLGGCVLTWTGFALAWRRFLGRTAHWRSP